MAAHAQITSQTGVQVYFADPHSPWQRGVNENTNGLVRHYPPKGSDLQDYRRGRLNAMADQINHPPQRRAEQTPELQLANSQRHSAA